MRKRVTILMSVYNGSAYLSQAIESIINQTFGDFEFVIYDDASTDESYDIIRRYKDPRIEIRVNSENKGLTKNLAEGIFQSKSNYIARMDADDIAHPDRIRRQVEYLDSHSDVDVLGTNVVFFNEKTKFIGRQPETHDEIAVYLFFGFTMIHPTVILRREALMGSGMNYNPEFVYSQDLDLWVRMLPHHKFANLQDTLVWVREHDQKISRARREAQQKFTGAVKSRLLYNLYNNISNEQLKVFLRSERGDIVENIQELLVLQQLLQQLITNNNIRSYYQKDLFLKHARYFFYDACRRKIKSEREYGISPSLSDLRLFKILDLRQLARLALISLFSFAKA